MAIKMVVINQAIRNEGCLGKAAHDEEIFVLRAQDRMAPALIDLWADALEMAGGNPEKIQEARECAVRMRLWPNRKVPD